MKTHIFNTSLIRHLIFIASISSLFMSAGASATERVIVAGDSWAFFVCVNQSLRKSSVIVPRLRFKANRDCFLTSRVGMRAENWFGSSNYRRTLRALKRSRNKFVFLSLGGNDLLNEWNQYLSLDEEEELFKKIRGDIQKIIKGFRSVRPNVKVLLSGYDFPRFTPNHRISAYRNAYRDMGEPTPLTMNTALVRFSKFMNSLNDENTLVVHHLGVMHYHDGVRDAGLAPNTSLHPFQISSPTNPDAHGGWLEHMANESSMLNIFGISDAFHLDHEGYRRISEHSLLQYIRWRNP